MATEIAVTIGVMKRVVVFAVVLIALFAPQVSAATPSCSTFDGSNRPASNFGAGDKIIVRGTGFAANSLVLVTFQQGTRTAEVAHLKTNDLGAFSTDPSSSRLPAAVDVGPATVQVLQGSGAASCRIQLVTASSDRPGGFGRSFYLTWGSILAVVAIAMAIATVRRWQGERLAEEMDSISWEQPTYVESAPDDTASYDVIEVDDDRPLLEQVSDPGAEDESLSDVGPVIPERTSDAVARLQREVRGWHSR